jgi:predicted dithiol-disulfide oxidoreductase (DUF899 family)
MTPTNAATREQWLIERRKLLEKEKAHTREKDAISEARRSLPWVKLENDYVFDTGSGTATLKEMFGENSQLIVYHFMFCPDWEEGCKSCSFWADSFNGLAPHLKARDITFIAVSRAPMSKLTRFRKRMGWDFPWVSSAHNTFNADFHVGFSPDQLSDALHVGFSPDPMGGRSMMYNFSETESVPVDEMHGTSVFALGDDGFIYHTYSTYGRGLDITNAAYSYIDMTPKGRHEPAGGNPMAWLSHHDSY